MKTVLFSILGFFPFLGIILFISYTSSYNYGNRMDNKIQSQYKNMENVLAQYSQKVREVAQVPGIYKDDLKEIVNASMSGRYGKDGSKAVFQFLKEHNQTLDSSMYVKIQQIMEAGRNDFQFENTKLIDMTNEYKIAIGSFYQGFWLRIAGFPKIDLEKYKPISNSYAKDTFEKGYEDGPIKLR